jgi:predicted DNA-binding transcriptional regulator AlpA
MKNETLLTVQEAMAKLGISRAALYGAMATGKLAYTEKYGKRLLSEQAIKAYTPRNYRGRRVHTGNIGE